MAGLLRRLCGARASARKGAPDVRGATVGRPVADALQQGRERVPRGDRPTPSHQRVATPIPVC